VERSYDLLFALVDEMVAASRDVAVFWQELIGYYRDMLVTKTVNDPARYLDLTDSEREVLISLAARFTKETLLFHIGLLEDALFAMQKSYAVKRTVCEITLVRLCDPALDSSVESLLARLSRVEEQLAAGVPMRTAPAAPDVEAATPAAAPAAVSPVAEEPVMDEPSPMDLPPELWEPPMDLLEPTQPPQPPVSTGRGAPAPGTAPAGTMAPPPKRSAPQGVPVPPAVPMATPAASGGQRVLRPLRAWTEAVERVKSTSRMAASFLISAKPYTTEAGQVVVKMDSTFARDMVAREGAPEALRGALSVILGRMLDASDILYEVEDSKQIGTSLIDLIIEAAEE
jgi:hypothetical protein